MSWPSQSSLVILDELHKLPKWKNYLKGIIDQTQHHPPLIVTGSARLETFRRQGDALTGRTFHYRLHPLDPAEAKIFLPDLDPSNRITRLISAGGFPEAFLDPANADRLRNDRFDIVVREDLLDLSRISALRSMELLIELLRERVGSSISYSNLAGDLSVSSPTVKTWIEILERLYLIFILTPFHLKMSRAIKKEPKIYFLDCAAAYEQDGKNGARFENLVACALVKYCQYKEDSQGIKMSVHYYRDRDNREIDFIVTENRRVKWCIEAKLSDDHLSTSLNYLHSILKPEASFQLVLNATGPREKNGIKILPATPWLEGLMGW